jgi:hypothetical protein
MGGCQAWIAHEMTEYLAVVLFLAPFFPSFAAYQMDVLQSGEK